MRTHQVFPVQKTAYCSYQAYERLTGTVNNYLYLLDEVVR